MRSDSTNFFPQFFVHAGSSSCSRESTPTHSTTSSSTARRPSGVSVGYAIIQNVDDMNVAFGRIRVSVKVPGVSVAWLPTSAPRCVHVRPRASRGAANFSAAIQSSPPRSDTIAGSKRAGGRPAQFGSKVVHLVSSSAVPSNSSDSSAIGANVTPAGTPASADNTGAADEASDDPLPPARSAGLAAQPATSRNPPPSPSAVRTTFILGM